MQAKVIHWPNLGPSGKGIGRPGPVSARSLLLENSLTIYGSFRRDVVHYIILEMFNNIVYFMKSMNNFTLSF